MQDAKVQPRAPSPEPSTDPLIKLFEARRAEMPLLVGMSLVAAVGGAVWLGPLFALRWFTAVAVLTALSRVACWRLCRSPPAQPSRRRAVEIVIAADTLVYTLVYCLLPLALVAKDEHFSIIAGAVVLGAIAVSGTSEFVISRLVGSAAILGLTTMAVAGILWGAHLRQWPEVAFTLFAVFAFFGYVLDLGLSGDRNARRTAAALAIARAKETDAEAANAAKSSFLATMSHEIRTPLNGVLGMAQAMEADELSDAQRRRLTVIRSSGEALLALLNDVLDLSKIEAGKVELESITFDVAPLAAGVEAAFAHQAADKGLSFLTLIAPEASGVWLGDPTRLRQILYNLVSNAVKFTARGGVSLSVDRQDESLRFVVADTGVGVPADKLDMLFDKFSQVDASTTRRHGGTGLGLAICRELAGLMGGRIAVESGVGEGSRFTLTVPLRRSDAAPTPAFEAAGETQTSWGGLRLLAAEDNPINQLVLKTLLAQIGVEPTMVENGEEAIAAWEDGDWAAILMDVQLPVMDGVAATREIRRREAALGRPRTPIIALTANAMAHQIEEYAAAGMEGHVAKPIAAASLFTAIEAALDAAAAEGSVAAA